MLNSNAGKQYIGQIYLILYGMYVFISILSYSLLNRGFIQTYGRFAIIGSLVVLYLATHDLKLTFDRIALGLVALLVMVVSVNNSWMILVCFMFFMCADLVEFRSVVKVSLIVGIATTMMVVVSCALGIIENYAFKRNSKSFVIVKNHVDAWGFSYYSTIPFLLFFFFMMYLYLRKSKLEWIEIFFWVAVDLVQMVVFTCRLIGMIWLFGILLYIVYVKYDLLKKDGWCIRFISKYGFIICFAFVLIVSMLYNKNNDFMHKIINLKLFNHRLEYSNAGLLNYGIQPLGQKINFIGNTDVVYGSATKADYNYIDIGYIRTLISHGPVFLAMIMAAYTYLVRKASEHSDKIIVVWCVCIMVFTMVNNVWIDLDYNPLLLYIPSVLLASDSGSITKSILWGKQDDNKNDDIQ